MKKTMNTAATATGNEKKKGGKLKLTGLLIGGVAAGVGTGLLVRKMKKSGKLLDTSLNQDDVEREEFEEEDGDKPDPIPPAPTPEPAETLEKPDTETKEEKGDDENDSFVSVSMDATVGGKENTEDKPQYFKPSALVTEEEAEVLNHLYVKYMSGTDNTNEAISCFRYICRIKGLINEASLWLYFIHPEAVMIETEKERLGKSFKRTREDVLERTTVEFSTPVNTFIDAFVPRMNALMDKKIEELRKETPEGSEEEKREA